MWLDVDPSAVMSSVPPRAEHRGAKPYLRCDTSMWNSILDRMKRVGMNMIVIDLGEGVRYESHPELGVKGAWSTKRLRRELARIRKMGIEPIPKLNFATTHDEWLGPYARMVSTPEYYRVARDLIAEVCDLFDGPRLFHVGMDEENFRFQRQMEYAVVRQRNLWYHDAEFFFREVRKGGARPWIWADHAWHDPEFLNRIPKTVLLSNWYYLSPDRKVGRRSDWKKSWLHFFGRIDRAGYDQVPTAATVSYRENFRDIVDYCRTRVGRSRLAGFLQSTWLPTLEQFRAEHLEAVDAVGEVIARERECLADE